MSVGDARRGEFPGGCATQLGSSLLIGPFDQWNLVTTGSGPGACGRAVATDDDRMTAVAYVAPTDRSGAA